MGAHTLFRWLGAAGIELQSAGHVLAIDPYVTRLPFRRQLFARVAPDGALVATRLVERVLSTSRTCPVATWCW